MINDIFRLSESRSRPGDFELNYYRGIFGLFAIAYFFSSFINPAESFKEFLLPRPWFALIPLLLFIISFFTGFIRKNISAIAGLFFLLATIHLIAFFYINSFRTRYEIAIITLVLFSNLHLNRVLFVVLYNVIVLAVLEYAFITFSGSGISPFFFFVFVLTVMLICVSYQLYRLRLHQSLIDREKILTDVFNKSGDAWILFDVLTRKAGDANEKTLSLLEMNNSRELENFNLDDLLGKDVQLASLLASVDRNEFINREINFRNKKGTSLSFNVSITKIPGAQNLLYCRLQDISRDKRQRELAEARALEVRYFLENVDEGIVVCNNDGNVKLISNNFCDLLGFTQQELLTGNKLFTILNNNLAIDFGEKEFVKTFESKLTFRPGVEMWLSFSGKKIKSPIDESIDNLWVIRNITPAKQKDVLLNDFQPAFNKLFDEDLFGVTVINRDEKFVSVNKAFSEIIGYNESELSSLTFSDISHPDDLISKNDEVKNILTQNVTSVRKEKRLIRKDGAIIWTSFNASLFTGNGPGRQALVVIEDITPQKNIEKELKQVNENVVSLIENTNDAICSVDYNLQIIVVNSAFSEKFFEESKIRPTKGMNLKDVMNDIQKTKWLQLHERAMKGEKISTDETVTFSDQSIKHYETSLHPIVSENGTITGVTYFSRDVTERKIFEEELFKAKVEAVKATTAKSQFLATMSHEIRTPLNGLIGMLDLLKTTKLDQKQTEFVDTIQLSGEALLQIINDILDYSKIESDKMELESQPFELKKCIEETFDILYYKAQEKNIDLLFNIDKEIAPIITGDKARLRQVLINLAGNAIKFTQKGHIIISVNKIKQENDLIELQFAVLDTGTGIPADQMDRLFKAFSQADASTFRKYGGTGLGLAICSRLVGLMNGKIWAESVLGEGSTFYFTLKVSISNQTSQSPFSKEPIVFSKYNPDKKTQAKTGGAIPAATNLAKQIPLHILVAEDNEVNQKLIAAILKRLGYEIKLAGDGKEVLKKMSQGKFDFIFMDVQMPEMDGLEATEEIIKKFSRENKPVIIAMTAFALEGDKEKCLKAGMDDYISKPIKIEEIQAMIEKWGTSKSKSSRNIGIKSSLPPEEKLLDMNAIKRIKDLGGQDDSTFLQQVINMFLKQAPSIVDEILIYEKNGDIEKMWQAAHKLKGSSMNIGAKWLAAVCKQVEIKGRESELKDIGLLTSQLKNIFTMTEAELKKFLQ